MKQNQARGHPKLKKRTSRKTMITKKARKKWIRKKKKCEECKKPFRFLHIFEGKFYCLNCYKKVNHKIIKIGFDEVPREIRKMTLKDALEREYSVKMKGDGGGYCYFPPVLIGRRLKIM